MYSGTEVCAQIADLIRFPCLGVLGQRGLDCGRIVRPFLDWSPPAASPVRLRLGPLRFAPRSFSSMQRGHGRWAYDDVHPPTSTQYGARSPRTGSAGRARSEMNAPLANYVDLVRHSGSPRSA